MGTDVIIMGPMCINGKGKYHYNTRRDQGYRDIGLPVI